MISETVAVMKVTVWVKSKFKKVMQMRTIGVYGTRIENFIKRLMEAQIETERNIEFLFWIRGLFRTQSKIYDGVSLRK